jgi:hypothetical protein
MKLPLPLLNLNPSILTRTLFTTSVYSEAPKKGIHNFKAENYLLK